MMRVVHTSKSPFELWLLVAAVLSGVAGLIAPSAGSRVVQALPHWEQALWSGGIAFGGALALIGALTPRLWALHVERGALAMLAALLMVYTLGIVIETGPTTAVGAALTLGLGVACVARCREITVDIGHVTREGGS